MSTNVVTKERRDRLTQAIDDAMNRIGCNDSFMLGFLSAYILAMNVDELIIEQLSRLEKEDE